MDQISFDSMTKQRFYIDRPIRIIELFAGIGAFSKALTRLGADFEHYKAVDFCKYKIAGYNAIHGTAFNPIDITKMTGAELEIKDTNKYCYILTYSFPCQDLSNAGKREGMKRATQTRSGLLWEVERLLNETEHLPHVLIMENVPQVHDYKNVDCFREWITFLESKGYTSGYEDLNAKDYTVPQNRNRCFMVSLLGEYYYMFPAPVELKETLADRLEDEVDEKYYYSEQYIQQLIRQGEDTSKAHGFVPRAAERGGVSQTIDTRVGAQSHTSPFLIL